MRKKIGRIRMLLACFAFMLFVFAEMMAYAWLRVQCMDLGYEISRETAYNRRLSRLRNSLTIELERLRSLQRIERIAKKELGLKAPPRGIAIFGQ